MTRESGYTAGEWVSWFAPSGEWVVRTTWQENDVRITAFVAICDAAGQNNEANARLIAAAPTLLEFAVALDASWTETFPDGPESAGEGVVQMGEEHRALWLQCRQAISAATGQAGEAGHG